MRAIHSATVRIIILLFLILASSVNTFASKSNGLPIANNFSAVYRLESGLFTIGETRRSLTTLKNGLHVFESYTRPTGMLSVFYNGDVTERSLWKYENHMAVPVEYSYIDTNEKNKRDAVLKFDWDKLTVTNDINGDPWQLQIRQGTQDKLLYQVSIMMDLATDNKRKELNYLVADGGKLRKYDAKILREEKIRTPAGNFDTVRVVREDKKSITTLWCAPSLSYLPVRIEHYKKKPNTRVNAYLTKVTGLN